MAEHYYQLALKTDGSNGETYQAYAQFLRYKKGDYPKALEMYIQATQRLYDDAEVHMDFAEFLMVGAIFCCAVLVSSYQV